MKNSKKSIFSRSISGFLAFLTVFTLLASLSLVPVFAADSSDRLYSDIYTDYYINPDYQPSEEEIKMGLTNPDFTTPEKRLAAMGEPAYVKGNFELYVDKISGEVALKDTVTGDIMFSNPYDIAEYNVTGDNSISKAVKPQLLSQVMISYNDNGQATTPYNSFTDSALLGQISVKKLRGGVRVEYSIGEEETRNLVPRQMSYERYQEFIYTQLIANVPVEEGEVLDEFTNPIILKVTAFYEHIKINRNSSDEYKNDLVKQYPALKKYDETTSGIMVFTGEAYREIKMVERYIKTYCPKYTFEELDKDHMDTGYTSKDKAPANFRMALEYYITENGVEVRFPANGLSFDESAYELTSISILPYMGAGSSDYKGYNFIPDGSGTLMRFEDAEKYFDVTGKVYGDDYAYQEISSSNQEVFRMPVFGVVTSNTPMSDDGVPPYKYNYVYEMATSDKDNMDEFGYKLDDFGNRIVVSKSPDPNALKDIREYSSGFVAIVTEGDALTTITSHHGGGDRHPFNSAYCSFTPRPKDSYVLAEAISVGGSGKVTVVSDRKYTGSFKINYIMLTDPDHPAKDNSRTYYDASYIGMAKAYRDYLEKNGTITKLTAESTKEDIPFFIEAFGVTETDESVMSIPVTVKKPLTTFDQLEKMIDECQKAGIKNIGLRLTGFTNGGMIPTVPTKVKFEKVVGGNKGFTAFLKKAASKGVAVYPEFDFSYMSATSAFDGFSYSKDAIKTIDNRYITKREYTAVLQSFTTTGKICISPCVYRDYFEKFDKSFGKILGKTVTNVSLGTLGSDLNSDFDDDDPYNREDAKNFTLEMLKQFKVDSNYGSIMVDAGNAYAMQYASIVLNAPLDSSRYAYASEAVPFFGMVYHGYVVFAGAPTNMAGDIKYATLKILENGATLYMMLSYDNVELLKEEESLSKYYAVNYEIWKKTLFTQYDEAGNVTSVGLYDKLNGALKDVQTSRIDNHGFISCIRQLTDAEKENIREDALKIVNKDMEAAYAAYTRELNKQDMYFNYILRNKAKLENAEYLGNSYGNIYDNSAELLALVDDLADDDLTEERYNYIMSLKAEASYGGVKETVLANYVVLQEIAAYYNAVGDTATRDEWSRKANAYKEIALSVIVDYGYDNIEKIMGDVDTLEAEYNTYLPAAEGQDSAKLTAKIAEISATYQPNLVVDDGSVVFVQYENGKWFILNYNTFVIEITAADLVKSGITANGFPAEGITVDAKEFYTPNTNEGGNQ